MLIVIFLVIMDSTKHSSCRKKPTYSILQYIQSINILFNYENEIIDLLVMLKYLSIQWFIIRLVYHEISWEGNVKKVMSFKVTLDGASRWYDTKGCR